MKAKFFLALFALLVAAPTAARAAAWYDIRFGITNAPGFTLFNSYPECALVPHSTVYVVDYPGPYRVYRYDDDWYACRGDRWYRADTYRSRFRPVHYRYVPRQVRYVPSHYRYADHRWDRGKYHRSYRTDRWRDDGWRFRSGRGYRDDGWRSQSSRAYRDDGGRSRDGGRRWRDDGGRSSDGGRRWADDGRRWRDRGDRDTRYLRHRDAGQRGHDGRSWRGNGRSQRASYENGWNVSHGKHGWKGKGKHRGHRG